MSSSVTTVIIPSSLPTSTNARAMRRYWPTYVLKACAQSELKTAFKQQRHPLSTSPMNPLQMEARRFLTTKDPHRTVTIKARHSAMMTAKKCTMHAHACHRNLDPEGSDPEGYTRARFLAG